MFVIGLGIHELAANTITTSTTSPLVLLDYLAANKSVSLRFASSTGAAASSHKIIIQRQLGPVTILILCRGAHRPCVYHEPRRDVHNRARRHGRIRLW
jgi:hypothetical protein